MNISVGNAVHVNNIFERIIGVMVWVGRVAIMCCHALQDALKVLELLRQLLFFAGLVSSDWAAHGGVSWPRLETTSSTVCPLIISVLLGVLDEHARCVNH